MLYSGHQYHIDNVIKIVKFERKYAWKKILIRAPSSACLFKNSALLYFNL